MGRAHSDNNEEGGINHRDSIGDRLLIRRSACPKVRRSENRSRSICPNTNFLYY